MVTKEKESGSVVKIDSELLGEVEDFISQEGNRLKFVNKKQFVDLAVNEFLSKLKEGSKK
jgi:hypothetical protein